MGSVRKYTSFTYSDKSSRSTHPVRTTSFAVALIVLGILLTGYFYIAPETGNSLPAACNLSSDSTAYQAGKISYVCDSDGQLGCSPFSPACQEVIEVTGQGDTLLSLMSSNIYDEKIARVVAGQLASVISTSLDIPFDIHSALKQGRRYNVSIDRDGNFLQALVEIDPSNLFYVACKDGSFTAWKEEVVLDFKVESLTFKMSGSLTDSLLGIGEGVELAMKLSNVFRWDIDFQSEAVRGDMCKVIFERRYADDRPSGYGNILAASYEGKKTGRKTAVLFNGEHYDETGIELKRNFLRSPLSEIRVTSHYGRRFHPILRVWRKHNGVDYGAAAGTPVWAVANGVVTFSGWQNGYGNYVCIKHDSGHESRYGHLQKSFVQTGQRVKQRQRIGLVGQTGLAEGPHLDFQLLVNNKHVNPLSVKMVKSLRSIPNPLKSRFSTLVSDRFSLVSNSSPIQPKSTGRVQMVNYSEKKTKAAYQ